MLRPTAINVKPKENYLLEVKFDNNETKTFDVKPYIKGTWFEAVSYTHLISAIGVFNS